MKVSDQKIQNIPIEKLEVWEEANVRKINTDSNIEELTENIRINGIENPLLVKKQNNKFLIFAGQRRFLASQQARIKSIPCRVFENIALKTAISLSLSENIFTRQMTTVDKANAVKELLDIHKDKRYVCKVLGIKSSALQVYLQYHGLSGEIKCLVDEGLISMQFAINVMRKFSKVNALEILRYVCSVKKNTVRRKLLVSAISRADKSWTLDEIKKDIRKNPVGITVMLDPDDLSKLQSISNSKKKNYDDMASIILKNYLSRIN